MPWQRLFPSYFFEFQTILHNFFILFLAFRLQGLDRLVSAFEADGLLPFRRNFGVLPEDTEIHNTAATGSRPYRIRLVFFLSAHSARRRYLTFFASSFPNRFLSFPRERRSFHVHQKRKRHPSSMRSDFIGF